jgi:membrane-bound lytic murein transglycosylase D
VIHRGGIALLASALIAWCACANGSDEPTGVPHSAYEGARLERNAVITDDEMRLAVPSATVSFPNSVRLENAATGSAQLPSSALDLTRKPPSLWDRIRNGFGMPDLANPQVREEEQWYSARQEYLKRTIARSSRYLYYIVDELQKRNMPSEIALLPFIESAYNPTALSTARASGIWQFMPSTGKLYGLRQDYWYDGRRDIVAATRAALDYLENLYDMFGSWDLALAAYNWGENGVTRAIAKNTAQGLPTDYQNLTMPTETRYYVPKLQAVKNIIAHPEKYGITLADVPNQPYFVAVSAPRHLDVKEAAKLADMPYSEFKSLNPGLNRPIIQSDGRHLLVPVDKADIFTTNLQNAPASPVSWQPYAFKPGDTIISVAERHHVSVAQLRAMNGIDTRTRVGAGSTLLVPVKAGAEQDELATPHIVQAAAPHKKSTAAHKSHGATKAAHAAPKKHTTVASHGTPRKAAAHEPSHKLLVAQRSKTHTQ